MKTCFVSMPFGVKTDPYTGISIDFDNIYRELVVPAISGTQYNSYRIDDVTDFSNVQKSIIESIINSDIMIADLTTQNPNVMYELGIRHMAQRGLTIMICSSGTIIPSNISNFRVISYELNADGTVTDKSKISFHQLLRYSIESNLEQTVTDSPVYQLFPEIKISLPGELSISESKLQVSRKKYQKKTTGLTSTSGKVQSIENLQEIQSSALNEPDEVDPIEFVSLLKKYRDMSAWKDLVVLAEAIPENLKKNPDVQQLYALALNRLGEQDKAIGIMEHLISQTGGDAESYGILGRIYKEKYENSKKSNDSSLTQIFLDEAIYNYKLGFEKQPDDYYTGANVVNLLMQRQDDTSKNELKKMLPRVRESLKNKMADSVPDYWIYATALELSCIAKEWDEAEKQVNLALKLNPDRWMMETTLYNLNMLKPAFNDNERSSLDKIISVMQRISREGLHNA